jgi:hypothetical protein
MPDNSPSTRQEGDKNMDESHTQIVSMQLDDGSIINVKATALGGSEDVLDLQQILPFKEVTETIEKVSQAVIATLHKVNPSKASVEFGVEVGIESGGVTALLVKGTSTGNLKVTLEWEQQPDNVRGTRNG